jgi:hypothetical protein
MSDQPTILSERHQVHGSRWVYRLGALSGFLGLSAAVLALSFGDPDSFGDHNPSATLEHLRWITSVHSKCLAMIGVASTLNWVAFWWLISKPVSDKKSATQARLEP